MIQKHKPFIDPFKKLVFDSCSVSLSKTAAFGPKFTMISFSFASDTFAILDTLSSKACPFTFGHVDWMSGIEELTANQAKLVQTEHYDCLEMFKFNACHI